jgi:hypothetical protein
MEKEDFNGGVYPKKKGGPPMTRFLRKWIAWYLVVAMFVIGITPRVYAGFAPSEVIGLSPAERTADLEKVRKFLEMKMVRERLKEFGYTAEEIQSKLSQLSEEQVHQLALNLDDLNVAGDSALGIIIALLIIAILVIVIIHLMGHKIVIKKS